MRDPNELRALLEAERRSAQPRPGGFDRLLRTRRRRQRNARLGAGVLALALAAGAIWGAAAAFHSSTPRPAKPGPTINIDTVAKLHLAWWGADLLDAEPVQPPALGDGITVLLSHEHLLRAFTLTCRQQSCAPAWKAQLPLLTSGPAPSAPVVGAQDVFVLYGRLYAYDVRCEHGGRSCEPVWTSPPVASIGAPAPVVDGSSVFIATSTGLQAYDIAACSRSATICRPAWSTAVPGGVAGLAVGDGLIVATGPSGLFVFDRDCTNSCSPGWSARDGASDLSPAVGGGMVFVVRGSTLAAYPERCAKGATTCPPAWTAGVPSKLPVADPIVGDTRVWVAGDRLFGYDIKAVCATPGCPAAFTGPAVDASDPFGWSRPAFAGGVMFAISDGRFAFDPFCSGSCAPIWSSGVIRGPAARPLSPAADLHHVVFSHASSRLDVYGP